MASSSTGSCCAGAGFSNTGLPRLSASSTAWRTVASGVSSCSTTMLACTNKSRAASMWAGLSKSLAPPAMTMLFCPLASTRVLTWLTSMPSTCRAARSVTPKPSSPTQPTMATGTWPPPRRAAATAWLAPLPPAMVAKAPPASFSPGSGMRGTRSTRSILILPITTIMTVFLYIEMRGMRFGHAGAAHMQLGRDHVLLQGDGRVGDAPEQALRGQAAQLARVLRHAGQRRMDEAGQVDVIEANHGQLARHVDAALGGRAQGADGHQIVAAEQRVGPLVLRQVEQRQRRAVAAGAGEVRAAAALRIERAAVFGQRLRHAGDALARNLDVVRTADAADAAPAQRQQMLRRQPAAGDVVDADHVGEQIMRRAVEQHGRDAHLAQQLAVGLRQRGQDQAVAALFQQHVEVVALLG